MPAPITSAPIPSLTPTPPSPATAGRSSFWSDAVTNYYGAPGARRSDGRKWRTGRGLQQGLPQFQGVRQSCGTQRQDRHVAARSQQRDDRTGWRRRFDQRQRDRLQSVDPHRDKQHVDPLYRDVTGDTHATLLNELSMANVIVHASASISVNDPIMASSLTNSLSLNAGEI